METSMMAVAALGMLLYVIFAGIGILLLVFSSLIGVFGGIACRLRDLARPLEVARRFSRRPPLEATAPRLWASLLEGIRR